MLERALRWRAAAALVVCALWAAPAGAVLVPVLGGLGVYDTDLDITWLADANAGAGSAFDDGALGTDGRMTWASANAWAASLNVGGFTGWRLPRTLDPDASCSNHPAAASGTDCSGSEMGHLFYVELSGTAGMSLVSTGDPDLALFSNLTGDVHWSEDVSPFFTGNPPVFLPWGFHFNAAPGSQGAFTPWSELFAWAVHDGNLGVPEPAALPLIGTGLLGLLWMSRRR